MEQGRERGRPTSAGPDAAVQIQVTALASEVSGIRHAIVAAAEAWGMSAGGRADVELAVSEACSNVVAHAYADAPVPGPLFVETYRSDGEFVVVVSDEGTGIAPRENSPGLGFGLPLMARLTQRLEIGINGRGGAKVTMAFTGGARRSRPTAGTISGLDTMRPVTAGWTHVMSGLLAGSTSQQEDPA